MPPKNAQVVNSPELPTDYDYSVLYKSPTSVGLHRQQYEQQLARLAVPYQRLYVPTRFGNTHLLAVGPVGAPPLVLLAGSMESALVWLPQLIHFAQVRTHRVYALDMPGHSALGTPVQLATNNSDWAIWLLDVLYELGIKKADFVGQGFGTGLILKLAGYTPGRINSATLINPTSLAGLNFKLDLLIMSIAARISPRPAIVRRVINYHLSPLSQISPAFMTELVADFQFLVKHRKFVGSFSVFKDEEVRALAAPTLVLMGTHNRISKLSEIVSRVRRLLPWARVEMVTAAGYAVEIEQPQYINESITNFLHYVAVYHGTTETLALG